MASRADSSGKRVHFDSNKEVPTQRDLLDRKAAESRIKDIGECGNDVIRSSNPDRAPIGTGGSDSVYQTKARRIAPPVGHPFSSNPKTLPKSGSVLDPPRRVPVRVPDRARIGEKR